MKKSIIAALLSIALVLVMVFALVPATVSAKSANAEYELPYNSIAPKVDGVVGTGEYSTLPFHKINYDSDEFLTQFDKDKSIKADFYACWDSEAMYLAWVVYSELEAYSSPVYGADALGNMWQHCCVQLMYTPYHPTLAEEIAPETYTGDYLELGVTMHEGQTPIKCVWNASGAQAGIGSADWDFAGNVEETTDGIVATYEIKFPWKASGLESVGNGTQIGLGYAIGDQTQFDVNNFDAPQNNMAEWMDCLLGGKAPKNLAIITLAGNKNDDPIEISDVSFVGTESVDIPNAPPAIDTNAIPEDATAVLQKPAFNTAITGGSATVITDIENVNSYNVKWAATAHLRPTDKDGVYEVVEIVWGGGNEITFANEVQEGDIALAVHGDDSTDANSQSCQDRDALRALVAGDLVTFLGYDFETQLFATNAVVYYGNTVTEDESSVEPSDEPSEEPSEEPSKDESKETESSTPVVDESKDDSEGGNTGLIIGIVAGVVAVIAVVVVVVIVLKKKKA
ncbi:MAG: hypothetical protein IKC06_07005 [Clostridia bacterium]|nr:hypothetical protein [Clostridia bacterium]